MSLREVTSWLNTNIPGAYPNITVQSQPVGLGQSGIIVIMGEADGGPSYSSVALKNNHFTPDQLAKVQNLYTSGPIVDAFSALTSPSNDTNIKGSANLIYIVKTNTGTRASASVPGYGTLSALNFGVAGNSYTYQVTSLQAEIAPQVTGTAVPAFGDVLNGDTFTIRQNGGAATVVTLSSSVGSIPAQADALSAYNSLNLMSPTPISSTLSGTKTAGVYSEVSGGTFHIAAAATLTLNGSASDVFVFLCSSTFITGAGASILLTGGALASNVYFVCGTSATLGATNTINANIIADASITVGGGTVNGSLIALVGAVTISVPTNIAAQSAPLLGAAGVFAVLGASDVTNTGSSVLTGDLGGAPGTSITGFPPGTFSGSIHRNDTGGGPALNNITELITALNIALPTGIVASAGAGLNTVELTMAGSAFPYASGSGESFELIDSTPGDLAALGLVAGLTTSADEAQVEVQINNPAAGVNETFNVIPDIALTIGYQGTTATLTKTATLLTTTVTGGSGTSLSVDLSHFATIGLLAAFLNSQPGYTAQATPTAQQQSPSALDAVTAISIASTAASQMPGRIKDAADTFQTVLGTSAALTFAASTGMGLPVPMATPVFLSGGTRGATLAADIVNAVQQMAGVQVNIIVPLFSQDATKDITAGLTDPSSTYTIAATNALIKNHCIAYSTPKLKRNRICILSCNDTYANCKAVALSLASYRCSLAFQGSTEVNSLGLITKFQPWYTATIAAGMQAGGFYKSICNKLANVIAFTDPTGFDSGSPGDVEDALSSGMLILTASTAGSLWVSDQTTYGFDANFVYNSIQAVYCSDILSLDLAASFQAAFVGQSLADVDAATGLSYLAQKMEGYKKLKLIAASDDSPLGWKNGKITILAPEMAVSVEIKLATAIYFIPISINISQVQQSAAA